MPPLGRRRVRPARLARRAYTAIEHFLHVEAASGIVLLAAAFVALVFANSRYAHAWSELWETHITLGFGPWVMSRPLHFVINDGLMTVFFLVVGIEIRRELHEGSLSNPAQAALPVGAAIGGVAAPALVYLLFNHASGAAHGWAVPTATDIAFAVGVLALLGKSIPGNVRIFLLTLAIIDDVIAVLIIAVFYSSGLHYEGFLIGAAGVALVLAMQRLGVGAAPPYLVPGVIIWAGFLISGAHPTLAGVVLGLMTPVLPARRRPRALLRLSRAAVSTVERQASGDLAPVVRSLRRLRVARRELLAPVLRVQVSLHPWVAFGIMPLFALANAGVHVAGIDFADRPVPWVLAGVAAALVVGKPLGVFSASWLLVKSGVCRLPDGVTWSGIALIALLAGIGFTMSVFLAMLAFGDVNLQAAAKLGVLIGSVVAGVLGLGWGTLSARRRGEI